jgi:hypothetical protein
MVRLLSAFSGAQPPNDRVGDLPRRRLRATLAALVQDLHDDVPGVGETLSRGTLHADPFGNVVEIEFCVHGSGIGSKHHPLDPIVGLERCEFSHEKRLSPKAGTLRLRGKGVAEATVHDTCYP